MKYFIVLFFYASTSARDSSFPKVSGFIYNDNTKSVLINANIININKVRGTDANGYFEIDVQPTDTLHISLLGFQSLRVKVTNDWIKNKVARSF
jgi:hypothetical protein